VASKPLGAAEAGSATASQVVEVRAARMHHHRVVDDEALGDLRQSMGRRPVLIDTDALSLVDVIAASAPWSDWLEDAVFAGYAPNIEGVEVAIRGIDAMVRLEVTRSRSRRADGDALGWICAFADAFRELARILEELATDLDREQIQVLWETRRNAQPADIRADLREIRGARERIRQARVRIQSLAMTRDGTRA
jgi:hypothetical protein